MESRVEASLHSSTTDLVYNEEEALLISSAKKSAAGAPKTCGHCGLPGHNQTKCFEQHSHGQGCVLPKDLIPGDYHFYKCRDNIPTSIPRAVLQPARPVQRDEPTDDHNCVLYILFYARAVLGLSDERLTVSRCGISNKADAQPLKDIVTEHASFTDFHQFDFADWRKKAEDVFLQIANPSSPTRSTNGKTIVDNGHTKKKKSKPHKPHTKKRKRVGALDDKDNNRKIVDSSSKNDFISGRDSEEILLVYPIEGNKNEIEAATSGLHELSHKGKLDNGGYDTVTDQCSASNEFSETNGFSVVIRVKDYKCLEPETWLNDSLVNFWMQWISRGINGKISSHIHVFSSHFYTKLCKEGAKEVTSWTAKKKINVFEKTLLFIPVCVRAHWSLCVVVNPGHVEEVVDEDWDDKRQSCMLHFDSLTTYHKKGKIQKLILDWLNTEWLRLHPLSGNPFNDGSCLVYNPQGVYIDCLQIIFRPQSIAIH